MEIIWLELHLNRKRILLGNIYKPPHTDVNAIRNLGYHLERVIAERKEVVLMGDLNCNMLVPSHQVDELLLIIENCNLSQLITEPTRTTDRSSTLIDLIFTTNPEMFSGTGTLALTSSDHQMIYGEWSKRLTVSESVSVVRSYKRCSIDDLMSDLETAPWQVLDIYDNVDDKWNYWKTLFLDILDKHAPLVKVRRRKRENDEWIDAELRQLMRSRNYFRRKHWRSNAKEDWERFNHLKREVNRQMRKAKAEHYATVCKGISWQPKRVWRQLNAVLGRGQSKPMSSLTHKGTTLTKPETVVDCFLEHFSNLPIPSPGNMHQSLSTVSSIFRLIEIEEEKVVKKLTTLDEKKATGPDMISAKILRMVAPAIANSLTALFNASIRLGQMPTEWKETNVTPVPKTGDKHDVTNYRPVSVIPVLAKVFESLIHQQLYDYLEAHELINEVQAGFRPNHSTQDVLLKTVDDWRTSLDKGDIVGTIMIDLSKAFDSIDHIMLLKKINAYGVCGRELAWFTNYLQGRKYRVVMEGVKSEWRTLMRGVPQGSILGPLLFILFINDLPNAVEKCIVNLYADITIYTSDSDAKCVSVRLEEDLSQVAKWIMENGLKMNIAKTQLMVLSRKCNKRKSDDVQVRSGDQVLTKQV